MPKSYPITGSTSRFYESHEDPECASKVAESISLKDGDKTVCVVPIELTEEYLFEWLEKMRQSGDESGV